MKSFLFFILKLLTIPISFILTAIINTSIGRAYINDFPFNLTVILYILFGILILIIAFLYLNDIRRYDKFYIKFGVPILSFLIPLLILITLVIDKSFASKRTYNKTKVLEVIEYMDAARCTCKTNFGVIELDLKDCINVDSIALGFSESLFKNRLIQEKYKIEQQINCTQYQELSASEKIHKRCFKDALIDLNNCIKENPTDYDCLYKRGLLQMHKGDYENAQYDFIISLISQNIDYGQELKEFTNSETFKNYKTRIEDLVKEKKTDELVSFVDNFERLGNFKSTLFRIEYCEEKLKSK